jgi:hypothetical protein
MPGIPAPKHAPSMTPSQRPDFVRAAARHGAPASGSSRQGRVLESAQERTSSPTRRRPTRRRPTRRPPPRKTRGREPQSEPIPQKRLAKAPLCSKKRKPESNPRRARAPRRAGRRAARRAAAAGGRARPQTARAPRLHASGRQPSTVIHFQRSYKCEFTEISPAHCPHCCHTDRRNKPWSE